MKLETTTVFKNIKNNPYSVELSDEELKKLQEVLLSILTDFNNVCNKYNIEYTLGGGSALGAIRHKGFIPWDDDIDVNISRKEYEKFKEVFKKELSEKYWFHTPEERPDLGIGMARLRLKGTTFKTRDDLFNDESGMFIDVVIIENTYDFLPLRYLHGFLSLASGLLLSCRNFYRNKELYLKIAGDNIKIVKTKIFIGKIISFLSVKQLTTLWNNINKMCKNNNSKYVVGPVGRNHFFGELYEREGFLTPLKVKFENIESYVCKDYDSYLKHNYGNYMEIPKNKEKHVVLKLNKIEELQKETN